MALSELSKRVNAALAASCQAVARRRGWSFECNDGIVDLRTPSGAHMVLEAGFDPAVRRIHLPQSDPRWARRTVDICRVDGGVSGRIKYAARWTAGRSFETLALMDDSDDVDRIVRDAVERATAGIR